MQLTYMLHHIILVVIRYHNYHLKYHNKYYYTNNGEKMDFIK